MKKIKVLSIILSMFMVAGCNSKKIETVNVIELNSKSYINQLEKITIKGTNDYFIITEKRSFDSVKGNNGSFDISIPYTINVDDVLYEGHCILGNHEECIDNNTKYNIKISNIEKVKDKYYAEILISEK